MVSPYLGSSVSSLGNTGDYRIDALLSGVKWGGSVGSGVSLSYSFPAAGSTFLAGYGGGSGEPGSVRGLTAAEQASAVSALATWSDVANIVFVPVSETAANVGDVRVAYSRALPSDAYAWAYYPGAYAEGGDVWLNANYGWTFGPGTYSTMALIHELGHALGLDHPFESGVSLSGAEATRQYSVMSYTYYDGVDGEPITPMLYDVLAIQYLYGANMTTRTGDTSYAFGEQTPLQCVWDAGGNDTFDAGTTTSGVTISLVAGSFSSIGLNSDGSHAEGNVAIAFGAAIENATGGAGSDRLTGNAAANRLQGNAGNDTLAGDAGNDSLDGGSGNDTLTGGDGNDTLTGGSGTDRLAGGEGNDVYLVDGADVIVDEPSGRGVDMVYSAATFTLGTGLNQLFLTGSSAVNGTGNDGGNVLAGNGAANRLSGGGGSDQLFGGGGNDTLAGDTGNDTLAGGSGADRFDFTGSAPTDGRADRDVISDYDRAAGDVVDLTDATGFSVVGVVGGALQIRLAGGDDIVQFTGITSVADILFV